MKGIKMDKNGKENTETFEMLTRTVDGEMCLDVECGPNKAVLYLSKLIGGSKNECILHDSDWLTPNAFQKRSGRGSAKDWKRSIRHNGVSLKTFMLCGILEMPADSKLRLKKRKETLQDSNLQSLKDKWKKQQKTEADEQNERNRSTDDDVDQIPVREDDIEHTRGDINADETTTDITGGLDKEQDMGTKHESGSEESQQNENTTKVPGCKEEDNMEHEIPKDVTEHRSSSTFKSAIQTNNDQEILVPEKLSVDPYEMTVTPPPTPPSQEYGDEYNGQNVQSKLGDKSENIPTIQDNLTIKYKPYLLHSDAITNEENSKGDNHIMCRSNPYPVTSPITEYVKQRNDSPNINENHRHSVIVTHPTSSTLYPDIPTDRPVVTQSAIQRYHHLQRSYATPDSDSKRYDVSGSGVLNVENKSEFLQTLQYSTTKDRVIMNEMKQYSGFKRQYDELEQDEPLDLSMKKRKPENHYHHRDRSCDDHVELNAQSNIRLNNKTPAPSVDAIPYLDHIPISKLKHNHIHPLFHPTHPLQMLKHNHSLDKFNPYFYGFFVNPLQN